jgi:hypothetical protein
MMNWMRSSNTEMTSASPRLDSSIELVLGGFNAGTNGLAMKVG